ncbi:MAG: hypothetical protein R3E95_05180 [Thiolinea sp.]
MKKYAWILALSLLLAHSGVAWAGGCNAACYAQKRAEKARILAVKRQQARLAHNRAIAAQKARRAALVRQQAARQRQQQARRHGARQAPRQAPRRVVHSHRQQRMTPQQQAAALIALRNRMAVYNSVSNAYQNTMNSMSWRMNVLNAQRACGVSGNCRVVTRRYY